jgi:hypothetical protein
LFAGDFCHECLLATDRSPAAGRCPNRYDLEEALKLPLSVNAVEALHGK